MAADPLELDDRPVTKRAKRSVGRPAIARHQGDVVISPKSETTADYADSPDSEIIKSLARGLQVLSAFGPHDDLLGNKDIATRTGISKPSVSRLTNTLVSLNFLERDPASGLYRLGAAMLALGHTARKTVTLPAIAKPFMGSFALEHRVSVQLGALDGLKLRAHTIIRADSGHLVNFGLGADFALDSTALGLGYLVGMPEDARSDLLGQLKVVRGGAWPESRRRIEAAIAQYEEEGYCTSLGEWDGTVNGIGAPLAVEGTDMPFAIACSASASRLSPSELQDLSPYFVGLLSTIQAAARRSLRRGFSAPAR